MSVACIFSKKHPTLPLPLYWWRWAPPGLSIVNKAMPSSILTDTMVVIFNQARWLAILWFLMRALKSVSESRDTLMPPLLSLIVLENGHFGSGEELFGFCPWSMWNKIIIIFRRYGFWSPAICSRAHKARVVVLIVIAHIESNFVQRPVVTICFPAGRLPSNAPGSPASQWVEPTEKKNDATR